MNRLTHMSLLACVGMLSGLLSSYFSPTPTPTDNLFGIPKIFDFPHVMPGVIFGAMVGSYFLVIKKQNLQNVALFTIFSAGSYAVAFYLAYYLALVTGIFTFGLGVYLGLMTGGLVGTKLLLISFNRFIHPIPSAKANFIMISGCLLSLSYLGASFVSVLFLCWQCGMAACLAKTTFPLEKKNTRKAATQQTLIFAILVLCILLVISQFQSICNALSVC